MTQIHPLIKKRAAFVEDRLSIVKRKVQDISELTLTAGLAIYVVGSYGRHEANSQSDIDLFFVADDMNGGYQPNKLTKTLIDANLIRIMRELRFPEFSNDGEYLEVHSLKQMLSNLGGREDDFSNCFTARLLLLLESKPIYNVSTYQRIVNEIVHTYFRDYHDHDQEFRPIFLVNDILRYWKTLCLNYEHKRNIQSEEPVKKAKNHLRNLKLKFSRMLTCFSMVIPLCIEPHNKPDQIVRLCKLTPLERLQEVVENKAELAESYNQILEHYAWFLETVGDEKIEKWISMRDNREEAFSKARLFGKVIYDFLGKSAYNGSETMKHLVM